MAQYLCRLILLGVTSTSSRERRTPPLNPEIEDIQNEHYVIQNNKKQGNTVLN